MEMGRRGQNKLFLRAAKRQGSRPFNVAIPRVDFGLGHLPSLKPPGSRIEVAGAASIRRQFDEECHPSGSTVPAAGSWGNPYWPDL